MYGIAHKIDDLKLLYSAEVTTTCIKRVTYQRGHITVLDRKKLEKYSCECYREVKRETGRLERSLTAPPQ